MYKKRVFFLLFFASVILHAQETACPVLKGKTIWRGELTLNDSVNLTFFFRIKVDLSREAGKIKEYVELYNANEVIYINEVRSRKDSFNFKMPMFDSEFKCRRIGRDSLEGYWHNYARKQPSIIRFRANQTLVNTVSSCLCKPFEGRWETTFGDEKNGSYKAVGVFNNPNCWGRLHGTFLTETGDYRYLDGAVSTNEKGDTAMYLSCFDGSHAFVFTAKKTKQGEVEGNFYSGSHWHEKFTARRNEKFELKHPDSLTFLKPGYDKINFSFPDLKGQNISLADERFKNKVVIVQIMGSWCPNCMDETAFLSPLYDKYNTRGLEVIGLAYERTGDMQKAVANVTRLKNRFDCNYSLLIASLASDKNEAAKTLPALNHIISYPTTIFIDKKGRVRKIHTGFNGPATGKHYERFSEETIVFIEKLLGE